MATKGRLLLVVAILFASRAGHFDQDRAFARGVIAAIVPNDELFDQYQWNLRQIRATEAWELSTGSSTVIIAVLDTGVSLTHPDLSRKLVAGHNFINESALPDDDHGNGTHVAGIAAADTNNRAGVAGISWQARIMPVKVLDSEARGDPVVAANGVVWAVDHGASIINLGLTGPDSSDVLASAVDYAYGRGVTVIAPVANNGVAETSYPAAYPHVIAVGATDRSDQRLTTSNFGSYISLAAPGERIASTFRAPGGTDTYAVASSTAQAAAHVTGVAALMIAINPTLKPDQIRAILEMSADDVGLPGRDVDSGAGRINAARAVLYASPWNATPSGAGSYLAPNLATNSIYFPLIQKNVSGWFTSFTVQNTSSKAVSLTVELFDFDGKLVHSFPSSLAAFASTTYQPAQLPGIPQGFNGSAAIHADGPVTGVVNLDNAARDRLTYEGVGVGARTLYVPLLMRSFNGWDTGLRIQNTSGSPARARVTYYTADTSAPIADSTVSIGALGSTTLYQPADSRLSDGWMGSAVIESLDEQLLAAVVNEVNISGADMSYVVSGRPGPAAYAPLVFRSSTSWTTDVLLQNASSNTAGVAIAFRSAVDPMASWVAQRSIDPNVSTSVIHSGDVDLPDGFVGSGVFRTAGGGQLAGVANQVRANGDAGMAYRLPTSGAPSVFLPLVYRGFAGWDSGIQVQNLATRVGMVTLTIYQQDGTVASTLQDQLDPGASRTFYLPEIPGVPSAFVGSAAVTSSNGITIAAIANHVK